MRTSYGDLQALHWNCLMLTVLWMTSKLPTHLLRVLQRQQLLTQMIVTEKRWHQCFQSSRYLFLQVYRVDWVRWYFSSLCLVFLFSKYLSLSCMPFLFYKESINKCLGLPETRTSGKTGWGYSHEANIIYKVPLVPTVPWETVTSCSRSMRLNPASHHRENLTV